MEASHPTASATRKANPRKRARTNESAPSSSASSSSNASTPLASSSGTSPRLSKTRRPTQSLAGDVLQGEYYPTRAPASPAAHSRPIVTLAATSSLPAATYPGQQAILSSLGPLRSEQVPYLPGPLGLDASLALLGNYTLPAASHTRGLVPHQEPYANPLSPAGLGHDQYYRTDIPLPDSNLGTFVIPQSDGGHLSSYLPAHSQFPIPPYPEGPVFSDSGFIISHGYSQHHQLGTSSHIELPYTEHNYPNVPTTLDFHFHPGVSPLYPNTDQTDTNMDQNGGVAQGGGMASNQSMTRNEEIAQQDGGWQLVHAAHLTSESHRDARPDAEPIAGNEEPPAYYSPSGLTASFVPRDTPELSAIWNQGLATCEPEHFMHTTDTTGTGGFAGTSVVSYPQYYDATPADSSFQSSQSWHNQTSLPYRREPQSEETSDWELLSTDVPGAEGGCRMGHFDATSQGKQKGRRPLGSSERAQTNTTRKYKACVRCRMQKIRCEPSEEFAGVCKTCDKVNKESNKVIHSLSCKRWKLTEVVLFRDKSLGLTKRWTGMEVQDIPSGDWSSEQIRVVGMNLGFYHESMELEVRKFRPIEGDKINRFWIDKAGNRRETRIGTYALASISKTQTEYRRYMQRHARQAMREYSQRNPDPIIREHYDAVQALLEPDEETSEAIRTAREAKDGKEADKLKILRLPTELMNSYVEFWFAVKNTIGSAHLDEKYDHLDMERESHPDYPLKWPNGQAQLSLPRMVAQQFNSIGAQSVMGPMRNKILDGLSRMMHDKRPQYFFTVYVIVFIMLHEASIASADRRRYAEQNSEGRPYSLPEFVEGLQMGCNILLCHWHYYRRNYHPLEDNFKGDKSPKAIWSKLKPWQHNLMARTCEEYQRRARDPLIMKPDDQRWDHEYYFVSQMFERDWDARDVFRS